MADVFEITLDYQHLLKELKSFDDRMPDISTTLMREVNKKVKAEIRKEAKSRGYKAQKTQYYKTKGYQETGYSKNLSSTQRNYSASIKMKKDAFYYKFIEFGANVPDRIIHVNGKKIKLRGFNYPANPLIYPIADSIWKTNKAVEIMEKAMQIEIDKQFKEK